MDDLATTLYIHDQIEKYVSKAVYFTPEPAPKRTPIFDNRSFSGRGVFLV